MIAVLKSWTIERMYEFFKVHGSRQPYIRTNPTGLSELIAEFRDTGNPSDNIALVWAQDMVVIEPELRPTAAALAASIATSCRDHERMATFCGICCRSDEDDDSDDNDSSE